MVGSESCALSLCTYVVGFCKSMHGNTLMCTCVNLLYFYIVVPDGVDMVNIKCGPVDVINQCNVTWNVSI